MANSVKLIGKVEPPHAVPTMISCLGVSVVLGKPCQASGETLLIPQSSRTGSLSFSLHRPSLSIHVSGTIALLEFPNMQNTTPNLGLMFPLSDK